MRRLVTPFLAAALVFTAGACKKKEKMKVELTEEAPTGEIASMVHAADPRAAIQFVKGFYDVEQNSWRWTMGKFAVTLRPPQDAATKGATLQLRFSLPDPVMAKVGTTTLTATLNGTTLPGETYTKPGEYVYTRDVPANLLKGDAVTVEFAHDKFLAAGQVETRELGAVFSSAGFEPK